MFNEVPLLLYLSFGQQENFCANISLRENEVVISGKGMRQRTCGSTRIKQNGSWKE